MAEEVEFYRETEFKDTKIGKLPKEWEVTKLSNLIEVETGKRARGGSLEKGNVASIGGEQIDDEGNILWDKMKFIPDDFYDLLKQGRVNLGDVLLVKDGATTGKVAIVKSLKYERVAVNEHVFIIRSKIGQLTNEFLFYFLFSKFGQIQIKKRFHGLIGGIIRSDLETILMPLPPLIEQQKIAEILSIVDEAIQKTDEIIAKTERLKRGLMQELLTKGVGHKEFKDTEIGRIPKEWEVRTLGEIGELSRGLSYRGQEKFTEEVTDGYLFLTLNSIKEGGGLKEDGWSWIRTDRLRERHFVREGDIVIANTDLGMQRGHILGAPAIVHFPSWYKKDVAAYSMDLSKLQLNINLYNQFLFYYLSHVQPLARNYQSGTNVWHLNLDAWSNELLIPIPPLPEQQKIAEILSTVDEKLEILRREKTKLERIKQWFMEELLTGRIRVRVA
jgi:type I restriction enzyme S subunit